MSITVGSGAVFNPTGKQRWLTESREVALCIIGAHVGVSLVIRYCHPSAEIHFRT